MSRASLDRHRLFRALVPAILGRDVQTQKRDDAMEALLPEADTELVRVRIRNTRPK